MVVILGLFTLLSSSSSRSLNSLSSSISWVTTLLPSPLMMVVRCRSRLNTRALMTEDWNKTQNCNI